MLVSLNLSHNKLEGTLPDTVDALANLQLLSLAENPGFRGPLPLEALARLRPALTWATFKGTALSEDNGAIDGLRRALPNAHVSV